MHYDFTAIPDADVPQAVEPVFQQGLPSSRVVGTGHSRSSSACRGPAVR